MDVLPPREGGGAMHGFRNDGKAGFEEKTAETAK
jgi:hypothetical protein